MLGYFSLSVKEVTSSKGAFSSKKRHILKAKSSACGHYCTISAFLIGQIGKNKSIANNPLNLKSILTECYTQLSKAAAVIGGMLTVLECKNDEKLIQLYEKEGFEKMDIGQSVGLVSMCKVIDFDDPK